MILLKNAIEKKRVNYNGAMKGVMDPYHWQGGAL